MNSIINNKYIHYFGILIAAILFILPAFIRGPGGADIVYHAVWAQNFSKQFWNGEFYPRWLINMDTGAGSPTFFFYPPVAYYFASVFKFTQGGVLAIWNPICFTYFSSIIIGGIFCYKWLNLAIGDRFSAFCGALVYFFLPYSVFSLYASLAFSEFFVFAWLPGLLYYTTMLANGKRRAVVGYAVCFALLIMSTIPGTIVAGGLPVLYFLFYAKGNYKKNIIPLTTAIFLGIGLSAVFWLPMFFDRINVRVGTTNEMWSYQSGFRYSENFQFFPDFSNKKFNFLEYIMIHAVIDIILCFLSYRIIKKISNGIPEKKHAIFWFFIILLALFMTSELSKPIWEIFPILQVIQFPSRFNSYFSFAFSAIIAVFFIHQKNQKNLKGEFIWFLSCLAVIYILSFSISFSKSHDFSTIYDESKLKENSSDDDFQRIIKGQFRLYLKEVVLTQTYLPIWVNKDLLSLDNLDKFSEITAMKTRVLNGDAKVVVDKWQPRDIVLSTKSKKDSLLQIGQFYYPYWRAVDDSGVEYKITPEENTGLINFNIPAGRHKIHLYLDKSPNERYGQYISLFSLILTCGYSLLLFVFRKRSFV